MPRGGRRPGAGAPKGNLNAARTYNRSSRAARVYATLLVHPQRKEIALAMFRAGFFRGTPRTPTRRELRSMVRFLDQLLFDSQGHVQSITIENREALEAEIEEARRLADSSMQRRADRINNQTRDHRQPTTDNPQPTSDQRPATSYPDPT